MKMLSSELKLGTRTVSSVAILAGSLLLSSQQALASGGNAGRFIQFQQSHPDLSRSEARQHFRAEKPSPRELRIQRIATSAASNATGTLSSHCLSGAHSHVSRPDLQFNRTFQINEAGTRVSTTNGIDLDLNSSDSNITLGGRLLESTGTVTISTAAGEKTLTAGSHVTAAEYVAVKQLLVSGKQDVVLDSAGRAVGGQFDLSQISSRQDRLRADDLFVPENVTGFANLGRHSSFQLNGDLTNSGSLIVQSTINRGNAAFELQAKNITNTSGATIGTASGTSINPVSIDLELHARDSISNSGSISSSGSLTLSAGDKIANTGGSVSAQGNLNLFAPNVVNSGSLLSAQGDVSFGSPSPSILTIDNAGGVIVAQTGAINIREANYTDSFNTFLSGGDVLSKELNVNTGGGVADVNVDKLTGVLNQNGTAAHVSTSTDNLVLGEICLTGDPTFKNVGDITLTGNINVGEALTILAEGNISNNAALTITAGDGTTGFPITMVAGAAITSAGTDSPTIPPGVAVATTINGTSATGGSIVLNVNGIFPVTINSRSTATSGNHNGGDIFMAAMKGGTGGGVINIANTTILCGGLGTGTNGNVTLIANSTALGAINGVGGDSTTGNLTITNAQPATGGNVVFNANGSVTSGAITPGTFANGVGNSFNNNVTVGNSITTLGGFCAIDDNVKLTTTNTASGTVSIDALDPSPSVFFAVDTRPGSLVSTRTLTVTSAQRIGSSALPLTTNAQFVSLTSTSEAAIVDTNTDVVVLSATSGDNLIATFAGSVVGAAPITAGNLFQIKSTTGNIGTNAAAPLLFTAPLIEANAPKGNVFMESNAAANTDLGASASGALNTFSVKTFGNFGGVNNSTVVTAKNIFLESTNGVFDLDGTYTGTATISLKSFGNIGNLNIGSIVAPKLRLESTTGNIGASGDRLGIALGVKSVEVISDLNSVFIASSNEKKFTVSGGFAQDRFEYFAFGSTTSTTIAGNITALGTGGAGDDLSLRSAVGTLTIAPSVTLLSGRNMDLSITAVTPTASKSKIVIGKNASLLTNAPATFGDILISVGSPAAPVAGVKPKNVSAAALPGSNINFGQFGFTAKAPINNLFAKGADITFNNPVSAKNISLGGNVAIVADPPVSNLTAEGQAMERSLANRASGLGRMVPSHAHSLATPMRTTDLSPAFESKVDLQSVGPKNSGFINLVATKPAGSLLTNSGFRKAFCQDYQGSSRKWRGLAELADH